MTFLRFARVKCRVTLTMALLVPCFALAADDGATLFKAKCAPCHGNDGLGKKSSQAPSLLSDKVKSMSDNSIRDMVASRTNGEMERKSSHTALKKRLTADQISAVVAHIRELQNAK